VIKIIKSSMVLVLTFVSLSTFANMGGSSNDEAEGCTSVDFRNEFPIKIRNQKSLAWCFAHASADNLQFAEKTNVQISAADIAINYGKSSSSKIINLFQRWTSKGSGGEERPNEYGLAKFASQMIIEQGYCPESYFPSEDWQRVMANGQVKAVEIALATKDIYALAADIKNRKISSPSQLPYYYQFKNIDAVTFFNILAKYDKNKILDQIRMAACDSVRVPFRKDIDVDMKLNVSGMLKAMNQSLSAGKTFSLDLYNQIFSNIDNNKNGLTNLHTVIVYGRKYDAARRQCLYLVKNSYSESCSGYDPRLHCDKGYLWFPGAILQKNMTSAVFFK
jgi:hypothetical protein